MKQNIKNRIKYIDLLISLTERGIKEVNTQGILNYQLDKLTSERHYLRAKLKGKNAPKAKRK